jgi:hypothetical protein
MVLSRSVVHVFHRDNGVSILRWFHDRGYGTVYVADSSGACIVEAGGISVAPPLKNALRSGSPIWKLECNRDYFEALSSSGDFPGEGLLHLNRIYV